VTNLVTPHRSIDRNHLPRHQRLDLPRMAQREDLAHHRVELAERVALANDLGIARQELEHERERSLRDCRVALEVRRAIALRGMQIAVAALVGAITIAIYLPIFKMGAVI